MFLSVIIPVFNAEKTIITAVDSVTNELMSFDIDWELIIVNDGSTDNTFSTLEDYFHNGIWGNQKVRIINKINEGVATARNTGLKSCNGEYVAFNDSDDVWLEGRLSLLLDTLLKNSKIDLIAGLHSNDNFNSNPFKKINGLTRITIHDQLLKNYFSPQASIFRKDILLKSGFFKDGMRFAEEGFFFNNIVYYGNAYIIPVQVSKEIISKNRWGDEGLSGNLWEMEKGELSNFKEAYDRKQVGLFFYLLVVIISLIKFSKRVFITLARKRFNIFR
jgi:glycosyltransferase involved in cell wall biosynthesis